SCSERDRYFHPHSWIQCGDPWRTKTLDAPFGMLVAKIRDFVLVHLQDELPDAVLLLFANKQDSPCTMDTAEITDKLGLHSLSQRHWYDSWSL
ncbi:hypothetical protein BHM03_00028610, partial [Ensete ventricosum]